MKNKQLLRTNLLISAILILGFAVTAFFAYRANYQASLSNIEQVSSLTAEGIYYQLTTMFTKPVNISLTMAHDSLLVQHLADEKEHLNDAQYIETTKRYLRTYQEKYGFDSVFLVSTASGRYYNFNGVDRVLAEGNSENVWYYDLLASELEYDLEVDNDEVDGADNAITVFVNCKVADPRGRVLGVVGVGIRIDYLKDLLRGYEDKFQVEASLIGDDGTIEISTAYTGYEKADWFKVHAQEEMRRQILHWREAAENLELWSSPNAQGDQKSYVVTRYIPEISWHLVVEKNTGQLLQQMRLELYKTCFLIVGVVLIVLLVVTTVIRKFNRQITELIEERQAMFKKATEQLYDTIYELNITRNCYVGKRTEQYFESLGAKGFSYDEGLRVIAEKQIRVEDREGYIATFNRENVIRQYESGVDHLRYDFMISEDGENYRWMRIDAHIFYSAEDDSIHMFTYRKNIDAEKQKEFQAETDEMTLFYTKKATERNIDKLLAEKPRETYAFFIFDIDNFKQSNDLFGHAFGDFCIKEFTGIIRSHFRTKDLLGRIGGDEFVVFLAIPDAAWAEQKVRELSAALNIVCKKDGAHWRMSASIGVAIAPRDGTTFDALYRNADAALYQTKQRGKNGFTIYAPPNDAEA